MVARTELSLRRQLPFESGLEMPQCTHCGYEGKPRLASWNRIILAGALWLVPLFFLSKGFWPVGIVVVTLITAWAVMTTDRICPACKQQWNK